MSTLTTEPRTERPTGRRLLRGLPWLVVRQHRGMLYALLAVVVLGAVAVVYQRAEMIETLDAAGWPEKDAPSPLMSGQIPTYIMMILGSLPVLTAVFFGATLIAGDQEQGTAQLATTQSVQRRRWLGAKLICCYAAVTLAAVVLSAFYTWWWKPYYDVFPSTWIEGDVFDNTGPMLPALTLFLTAAGVTIGLLMRRVLPAMMATFAFSTVVQFAWGEVRDLLAPARMLTYPLNDPLPARYEQAHELDRWIGTADGRLYGWGHCTKMTEAADKACVKENGIVNNVMKYLDYDQMPAMQWTGAGILLAGTAALTVFIMWRGSRRPL